MTGMGSRMRLRAGLMSLLERLNRPIADLTFALLLTTLTLLAGWLLARHDRSWDWTLSGRNSLSDESLGVLAALDAPIDIRVFAAADGDLMPAIDQVLQPYRRATDQVHIEYIDPQLFPKLARAADVRLQGQLVLEYRDRRVALEALNEPALTNAIARLQLEDSPRIAVLEGHGERALDGGAAGDLRRFAQLLIQRGFRMQPLDLTRVAQVPDNLDLLIVSTPAIALFPGEGQSLVDYLERGGNLLWLLDPPGDQGLLGLGPLRDALDLRLLPGQVVDAAAGDLRLDAPTFAVVEDWPRHPLTADLQSAAVFPGAVALTLPETALWWQALALKTGALSWNETGPVRGEIGRDPEAGEQQGPLNVALLLTRAVDRLAGDEQTDQKAAKQPRERAQMQRIAVVGDGDFLANAHLEQGANKAFGLQLLRWLTHRDDLISVPPPPNDRVALALSPQRILVLSAGGLVLMPALLLLVGLGIYWTRTRLR